MGGYARLPRGLRSRSAWAWFAAFVVLLSALPSFALPTRAGAQEGQVIMDNGQPTGNSRWNTTQGPISSNNVTGPATAGSDAQGNSWADREYRLVPTYTLYVPQDARAGEPVRVWACLNNAVGDHLSGAGAGEIIDIQFNGGNGFFGGDAGGGSASPANDEYNPATGDRLCTYQDLIAPSAGVNRPIVFNNLTTRFRSVCYGCNGDFSNAYGPFRDSILSGATATIPNVYTPPTAVDDSVVITPTAGATITVDPLSNDEPGFMPGTLYIAGIGTQSGGTCSVSGGTAQDTVNIVPNPGATSGYCDYLINQRETDGYDLSRAPDTGRIYWYVYDPNPDVPPVATLDFAQTDANYPGANPAGSGPFPVTLDVLANDVDPNQTNPNNAATDPNIVWVGFNGADTNADGVFDTNVGTTQAGGTVTCGAFPSDGPCIYTPPNNYVGTDTFLYQIKDEEGQTAIGVANIVVVGNQAPIAVNDSFQVLQDSTNTGLSVAPNDFDLETSTGALTYLWPATLPAGVTGTTASGTFNYSPPAGTTPTVTFDYWVCDNHALINPVPTGDGWSAVVASGASVAASGTGNMQNKCTKATVTIKTVKPPPVPPVAAPDNAVTDAWYSDNVPATTGADVDININLVANDFDPNGATGAAGAYPAEFTVTQVDATSVNGGTVTNLGNGSVTYTPAQNFCGTDSFTYTIRDVATNDSLTAVGIVTVQVLCNSAPIAVGELVTVAQGGTVNGNVSSNDADDDPATDWTYSVIQNVANGNLTFYPDGSYSYTHNGSPTALSDSFTYEICDGHGMLATSNVDPASRCRQATVTIQVTADAQNPPVAVGDVGVVDSWYSSDGQAQTSTTINVAGNDSDADGNLDPTTTSVLVGPSATQGTIVNNGDGTLTFRPADGYSGLVTVVYQICDNPAAAVPAAATQLCAQAAVLITVIGNQPPLAINDTLVVDEDSAANAWDLSVNDLEIDGENLIYTTTPVVAPANGTVTISSTGIISYTPNAGYFGTDSFTYEVCDDHKAAANSGAVSQGGAWERCTTATMNIVVTETPDSPPIAIPDSANTTINTPVTISVLANDRDAEDGGPGLPVPPAAGIVDWDATTSTGATVSCTATECTYTPAPGFTGTDIFQYTIEDSYGNQAFTFVTISVTDDNTPPVAIDDSANTSMETPVTTSVLANDSDADGDPLTLTLLTPTTVNGGTVTCTATACTYTPAAGFVGLDTYSYMIEDGAGGSAIATVTVIVSGDDQDGDGIPDVVEIEICGTPTCSDGTEDTDGDGVPDWIEILMGTDPTDPNDNPIGIDTDGGGVDDWIEYMSGTDPTDPDDDASAQGTDSDGGGVPDWIEVILGTDPTDASDDPLTLDTDGDGVPDWIEILLGTDPNDPDSGSKTHDSDGGGVPDWIEAVLGTNPDDPSDDPLTQDTDGDGVPDWVEILMGTDPNDAKDDPGSIDTDKDGVPDWVEIIMGTDPNDANSKDTTTDSDLGGVPDWIEILMGTDPTDSRDDNTKIDADGDGFPDYTEYAACGTAYCYDGGDLDNNGVADWIEVIMCGSAGCVNPATDSDQDGIPDWREVELCGTTTCAGKNGIVVSDLLNNPGVATAYTGQLWTMWAFSYVPGSVVTFELHPGGAFLGTVVANADGVAVLRVELPCDVESGVHQIVAKGQTRDGQLVEQSYRLNILPGPGCPDTGTGGNRGGSGSGSGAGTGGLSSTGGSTSLSGSTRADSSTAGRTTTATTPARSTAARAVAFTGSDPLILTFFGAGLLLVGLAVTRMVRRRRVN